MASLLRRLTGILAAAVALWVGTAALAEPITGSATAIDGDTLKVGGVTVRLWGIDAPEGRQECVRSGKAWLPGPEATEGLRGLLARSGELVCEPRGRKDRNGRTVALCRVGGLDIGDAMVRAGWAFDYEAFSGRYYQKPEAEARAARRGVWSAKCQAPWEWRAARRL